mgnify:CR=1 FL=1
MRIFRRNILSLHIIFIKRTMRKEIILIAALSLFALTTAVAQSPSGDITARKAAVEELMERMRWADARAILGTMRGELDPVKDRFAKNILRTSKYISLIPAQYFIPKSGFKSVFFPAFSGDDLTAFSFKLSGCSDIFSSIATSTQ